MICITQKCIYDKYTYYKGKRCDSLQKNHVNINESHVILVLILYSKVRLTFRCCRTFQKTSRSSILSCCYYRSVSRLVLALTSALFSQLYLVFNTHTHPHTLTQLHTPLTAYLLVYTELFLFSSYCASQKAPRHKTRSISRFVHRSLSRNLDTKPRTFHT